MQYLCMTNTYLQRETRVRISMKASEQARVQNLLGAVSIGISDRIQEAAIGYLGHAGETAAAVVQIGVMPRMSIEELSDALKLSHSATVRLVAKLGTMGLIDRVAGEDKREVRLALTRKGKSALKEIYALRSQILGELTSGLSVKEMTALCGILENILARIAPTLRDAVHICRYCDEGVCPQDRCPMDPLDGCAVS